MLPETPPRSLFAWDKDLSRQAYAAAKRAADAAPGLRCEEFVLAVGSAYVAGHLDRDAGQSSVLGMPPS